MDDDRTEPVREERTLYDYWLVLYEQKITIAVVTASAVLMAAVLSNVLPSLYEARTVFYVPLPMAQPLLERGTVAPFPSGVQDEAKAYVKILKGNNIQRRVRARFPRVNLSYLPRDVDFSASREGMITIYVQQADPGLAAAVANAYIEAFNEFNEENTRSRVTRSLAALERQIDGLTTVLSEARTARLAFRERHSIASLQTELDELVKQRQALQKDVETTGVALGQIKARIRSTQGQLAKEGKIYIPTEMAITSPSIESLRKTLTALEVELAGKAASLTEQHPELISLREKQAQVKENLEAEIHRIMRSHSKASESTYETLRKTLITLLIDRDGTKARSIGLQDVITALSQKISAMPGMIEESHRLDQEVERGSALLTEALKQREALRSQVLRDYSSVVVVDTASRPSAPVFPNLTINVFMSLILGLLSGVMYAFFIDYIADMRRVRRLRGLELGQWLQSPS